MDLEINFLFSFLILLVGSATIISALGDRSIAMALYFSFLYCFLYCLKNKNRLSCSLNLNKKYTGLRVTGSNNKKSK